MWKKITIINIIIIFPTRKLRDSHLMYIKTSLIFFFVHVLIQCSLSMALTTKKFRVNPHLVQVECAGTPPRCTPRSRPCCSLSPAARTRCPSPTCQSQHCFHSLHPVVASPNGQQPVLLWSRLWRLLLAPHLGGGTLLKSARRVQTLGVVASTRRAGHRPECAEYRWLEPEELQQDYG